MKDRDLDGTGRATPDLKSGRFRKVDRVSARKRTTIVHDDNNGAAILRVRHPEPRAERVSAVCGRQRVPIENLPRGRAAAMKAWSVVARDYRLAC